MGLRNASTMLVLALTAAWIPVQRASAKTYVVLPEGGGDFPTIQDAVDASVDNDVIELGNGIFDGLGNTNVFIADKLITIRSQSDDPNQCIIDCNARGDAIRGFSVVSGDNIGPLIQGITVREGLAGLGGAIQTNGALRLTNCKFLDNESNVGGAVHTLFPDSPRSAGGGSIVIDGCDFIGNLANTQGGAIAYVNPSFSLTIMNCRFFRNQSRFGGAIFSTTGSPQISGSIFAENRAAVQGGAIVCITGAAISNCTFALNGAPAGGGAIFYGSPDPTTGFPSAGFILSVSNSIIAFSQGSHPVSCEDTALMEFLCCDIYGNAAGDWVGCLTGLDTENGNISQNPLFCGLEFADLQLFGDRFTLAPKSPCLPSKNCELIGARGQEDCIPQPGSGGSTGAEDLESATWGRIKSTYR